MADDPTLAEAAVVVAEAAEAEAAEAQADAVEAIAEATLTAEETAAMAAMHAEEQATERAKIAARTELKIAELQAEEPEWLTRLLEILARIEGMLTTQLIQPPSPPEPETVIVEKPEAPTLVVQNDEADGPRGDPVEPAEVAEELKPEPKPRRRWV
jgi:hypothetical protein